MYGVEQFQSENRCRLLFSPALVWTNEASKFLHSLNDVLDSNPPLQPIFAITNLASEQGQREVLRLPPLFVLYHLVGFWLPSITCILSSDDHLVMPPSSRSTSHLDIFSHIRPPLFLPSPRPCLTNRSDLDYLAKSSSSVDISQHGCSLPKTALACYILFSFTPVVLLLKMF